MHTYLLTYIHTDIHTYDTYILKTPAACHRRTPQQPDKSRHATQKPQRKLPKVTEKNIETWCHFWWFFLIFEGLGPPGAHLGRQGIAEPKKAPNWQIQSYHFWGHFERLFHLRVIKNRVDFFRNSWKASMRDLVWILWPKTSQKGASGMTFGAHLRDKGKMQNDAPARAGASFWRSEGIPSGLEGTTRVIMFSDRHFGFTFRAIADLDLSK